MYRKSVFAKDKRLFTFPLFLLIIFRFLTVSLLCFFLLSPFLKKHFKKIEKPIIVIAVDNSKSIIFNQDSNLYKKSLIQKINKLQNKFKKKYNVITYSFGNKTQKNTLLNFTDQRTNFSDLFSKLYEQTYNKNLGAVIIASDGIYNQGGDPVLDAKDLLCPIYTIVLGDTSSKHDILIKDINHNSIAFLGNKIPFQINIEAFKLSGDIAELTVKNENKVLFRESLNVNSNSFFLTKDVYINAEKPGLQKFTISISPNKKEKNIFNNTKEVFIEVLEQKNKVILVGNSPHPDILALKNALLSIGNYNIKMFLASDLQNNFAMFESECTQGQVIILHQMPSDAGISQRLNEIISNRKLPVLFILGSQTSVTAFNKLNVGLKIEQSKKILENAGCYFPGNFTYFNLPNGLSQISVEFPPLTVPYGNYKFTSENQILFYQKIGNINTSYPLISFVQNPDKRIGIISGEGIWRWRMTENKINSNAENFDALINKMIQFLSLKEDKRFFRITNNSFVFYEDEQVVLNAELYNKSFETAKNAKIKLSLYNKGAKIATMPFYETVEGYSVNAGFLPSGKYQFIAETNFDGKTHKIQGVILVKMTDLEFTNTTANYKMLHNLSTLNGGKVFFFNQIDELEKHILNSNQIEQKLVFSYQTNDLIDFKLFFIVLIVFLSVEWFLRKFYGSY